MMAAFVLPSNVAHLKKYWSTRQYGIDRRRLILEKTALIEVNRAATLGITNAIDGSMFRTEPVAGKVEVLKLSTAGSVP